VSTRIEETRERILEAARRLLVERGYHGVGIDQIAREAGVSRQAVYMHHFASKTELLLALVEYVDLVEDVAGYFRPVAEARSAVEAAELAVRGFALAAPKVHDIARVLDSARVTDPAAEAAWQDRARLRRQQVGVVLAWLQRERGLKPGWTLASATDFVCSVLSMQSYQFLVRECHWTTDQFVERINRALSDVLIAGRKKR
jgi:AcrR family transcriptional regulator